jgi:hypothetical protein
MRKKKPIGACRLCETKGPLELSHLMPRGVYEIILSADPGQKAPIMMTDRITVMKHQQLKDYLLCAKCEGRFSEGGEKYVQTLMCKPTGFKLLERLKVAAPMSFSVDAIEGQAYAGTEIGLDMDRLAFFGLSIFWRAGAHEWTSRLTRKAKYSIDLGDYFTPIGAYLLGGTCPEGMALVITAATDFLSQGYAFMPAPTVGLPVTAFGLLTCGIHFGLFLQKPLPTLYARLCSVNGPRRPVLARNLHDDTMHAAGRLYALGTPAKNMRAELQPKEKPSPSRRKA